MRDIKNKTLNRILLVGLALVIGAWSGASEAAVAPTPGKNDNRIKTYYYKPDVVYEFTGHYMNVSRLDLDPSEKIQNISMGDSTRWQINPVGSRIFLKPIDYDADTTMTIITDKRIYYFELYAKEAEKLDDDEIILAASFVYSDGGGAEGEVGKDFYEFSYADDDDVTETKKKVNILNYKYTKSGADWMTPIEVFDDGEFTYFKFKDINADVPAIFQVMPNGEESLINFRVKDGYVVIEMVTSQYTLRTGDQVACIFNEARPLQKLPPTIEDPRRKIYGR